MTTKTFKTALFALLVLSIAVPATTSMVSANSDEVNNAFEREYIKTQMIEKKAELEEERETATVSERVNIDKKIRNADIVLDIIDSVEKIEQNPDDTIAQEKLKEINAEIAELAGDNGAVTELRNSGDVGETIETDGFMPLVQFAHAAYNYFSFDRTVAACGTPDYNHYMSGYIRPESTLEVYLAWNFPSVMRLAGDCNTQLDFEGGKLVYRALESDLSGWYYCDGAIPETFPYGTYLYSCNYASAGDIAYLSGYSYYEDDHDYLIGATIKILS